MAMKLAEEVAGEKIAHLVCEMFGRNDKKVFMTVVFAYFGIKSFYLNVVLE